MKKLHKPQVLSGAPVCVTEFRACNVHSFGYIRPHLLRPDTGVDRDTLDDCVQKGYVAALGVGMQGVFTLTPIITPLCFLHWGGAAIFAGAAQAHATTAIELYEKAIASGASPVCTCPTESLASLPSMYTFWLTACALTNLRQTHQRFGASSLQIEICCFAWFCILVCCR